jgi:hypothetical protein
MELARQRDEENRKAAEAAKEQELPEIVGTEKQVPWAETIRQKFITEIDEIVNKIPPEKIDSPEAVLLMKAIDSVLTKTSASWFINNRYYRAIEILDQEMKDIQKREKASPLEAPESDEAQAKIEATIRPENTITETVAEIRTTEVGIEISFPERRDDFREIMKSLRMEWDRDTACWKRKVAPRNGAPADRAAEAGHRLLAAGFPVRIFNPEVREKALMGGYEPECTRWVMAKVKGEYVGWFSISWGRDEDFYKAAKAIGGSRYDKPAVVVPAEKFEEVLDFAQMYDFRVSDAAMKVAEEFRRLRDAALTVRVDPPVERSMACAPGMPPKLAVPEEVEVADEFKD